MNRQEADAMLQVLGRFTEPRITEPRRAPEPIRCSVHVFSGLFGHGRCWKCGRRHIDVIYNKEPYQYI